MCCAAIETIAVYSTLHCVFRCGERVNSARGSGRGRGSGRRCASVSVSPDDEAEPREGRVRRELSARRCAAVVRAHERLTRTCGEGVAGQRLPGEHETRQVLERQVHAVNRTATGVGGGCARARHVHSQEVLRERHTQERNIQYMSADRRERQVQR